MNTRAALLALVVTIASLPAYAQGPPAILGPPAGAGETVQTLSAKLAALTERVAKIESGQVTASDLVGSYTLNILGIELGLPPAVHLESVTQSPSGR